MEECAKWNILKVIKMNGIIVRIHHDHAIILIIMVINWCDARGEQQAVRGGGLMDGISLLFLNSDFECTQSQRQNLQARKQRLC